MEDRRLWSACFKGLMAMAWMALSPGPLQAQVGLASGVARVTLMAQVPARGSIQGVGPERENGRADAVREVSVSVRMSANTGHRLLVRRTGGAGGRIWVRTSAGEFQELTADAVVTVGSDKRAHHGEREVQYRIEGGEPADPLPVRYEIAINPTL